MTKTLLTTIGTGDYKSTRYVFKDRVADSTGYIAQALCQIFEIEKVIILLTPQARSKHWGSLQASLPADVELQDRNIPSGETEAEIWTLFETLVDSIDPADEIIFDITHAFRSIPVLVLLGAAFLRKAKKVPIQGIYYGLYRPEESQSPIVDLTPALRLLDWLTATDKFTTTGSALELGELLRTIHRDFYRRGPTSEAPGPTTLQNFGKVIKDISRSIELVRPVSLIEADLPRLQRQSTQRLTQEVGEFAKPFGLLLQSIQDSYAQLALPPEALQDEVLQIQKQFQLLKWYADKQFSVQAILLAREWVVSALCICEGIRNYRERVYREAIERQLGSMTGKGDTPGLNQPVASHVSDPQQLAACWSRLTSYRNDVAHTQMSEVEDPIPAERIEEYVSTRLLPELCSLFPSLTHNL
ncbi:TIGR02221 family CRISPR-associated protein [Thermostichus vulcanus]|uniref:TIGR02221 family CRISPR-associated protein n=1 Tax=Thermostichus vulcanus str. 'Rupite' TaxID=2813851 RepID=A0ABT0C703_THEVL|nr:TIGR02221 family CRISPR-associated protein [Thermostichus vulcanus]MCJ2541567.1 TIGR02221 family CRISPR-associated protein [Thermostichus vulcanus str. 'Rupite']